MLVEENEIVGGGGNSEFGSGSGGAKAREGKPVPWFHKDQAPWAVLDSTDYAVGSANGRLGKRPA